MDNFIEFSVSEWGITLSSAPLYFNLQWWLVMATIGVMIARKVIKHKRG
jgi:hypothetical protein